MKSNKALKEEYKSMKFRMGVFQIRNAVNNKIYIEGSINLDKIFNRHRTELNLGLHRNVLLQKEWNEFGEDKFKYEILSELKETDNQQTDYNKEVRLLANMFIEELKPFGERGYH